MCDCLGIKTLRENKPVLQTRNIDDRLLPYMVLVFDVILSAVWLLCWICSCGKWIQNYRNFDYANDESAEYLLLALSILPTVISFTVHLPYITIAYINGTLDSLERGTVEWNSGMVEWNSGMVERWNSGMDDPVPHQLIRA